MSWHCGVGANGCRGIERYQSLGQTQQGGEATAGNMRAERLVDALRKSGDDDGPAAGGVGCVGQRVGGEVPGSRVVVGGRWRVE